MVISKSAVHKHLGTLESLHYMTKKNNQYYLGIGFLDLGGHVQQNHDLYRMACDEVDAAAKWTDEIALLLTTDGDYATYIYTAGDDTAFPGDIRIGKQINLYSSPQGQTILTHLPLEQMEEIIRTVDFPVYSNGDPLDKSAFCRHLDAIRDCGRP